MSDESRIEEQLQALIDDKPYEKQAESRIEEILQSIIDDTAYEKPPESRIEEKLIKLKEIIAKRSSGASAGMAIGLLGGTARSFAGAAVQIEV